MKVRLFSTSWLEQPDGDGGFPTNGDRFAAQELKKRSDTEGFTRTGFICQAIAAGVGCPFAAFLPPFVELQEVYDLSRQYLLQRHISYF